jgi:hypothetical protein
MWFEASLGVRIRPSIKMLFDFLTLLDRRIQGACDCGVALFELEEIVEAFVELLSFESGLFEHPM